MSPFQELAHRVGIVTEYHQIDGSLHLCSEQTQRALLAAMGIDAHDDASAEAALRDLEAHVATGALPREIVVTAHRESHHDLKSWEMTLEDGEILTADPNAPWRVPPLPEGVHVLRNGSGAYLFIAAPERSPSLADLTGSDRLWGVTTSLYGLRSARNLGLGDYEDLARTAEALGTTGAAFLGINPVHSRGVADSGLSPYSPSSRTGFDTQHIALDRAGGAAQVRGIMEAAAERLDEARSSELVDYTIARRVQSMGLRAAFAENDVARDEDFQTWRSGRPRAQALEAVFEALSLSHGADWRSWPESLQDPASCAVAKFTHENAEEILFHDWCQWLAGRQLLEAQVRAKAAGMALGIYLDIAVGVRPGGAETWANRQAFVVGASLGAPPDLLNALGQSWALAPYSPLGLRAEHYRPFREMLRATMSRAGVVRIDHVIGFARSFMVPEDGAPGGYVTFPLETLLALTRIEAKRSGCVVIGEDLGTVPEGLREAMAGSGFFGCSIMPFERDWERLRHPAEYRPLSLASFGTHDLPTMAGWWRGEDITTRLRVGHLSAEGEGGERAARRQDRSSLCHLLAWEHVLPAGLSADNPPEELTPDLRDAVHTILACGSTGLVGIALDDMFLVTKQQNIPGTIDEEPNWRRKAPVSVEDMAGAAEVADTIRAIKTR